MTAELFGVLGRLTLHMATMTVRRTACGLALVAALVFTPGIGFGPSIPASLYAQPQDDDSRRDVSVAARSDGFHPARIEVRQNDLVKVTFTAEGGPHSFNVDAYRIAKRARPGRPAVFEFRADQAGTFPFYCNLSEAGGAHDMRGELVVRAR